MEAAKQFTQALTLAKRMRSAALEAQILRNIVRARLADNDLDAAARTARDAMIAAVRAGGQEEPAMLSAAAQLSLQRGRLPEARVLIERSFAGVDLTKSAMPMREGHLTAYRIHRAVGNRDAALGHLEALKRLDDESTKLATQTSTALMGARFDFANQELRITRLKAEELRRTVIYEQDKARSERTVFAGAGVAAMIVVGLLLIGLFTIRRSRDAVRAANDDLGVTNAALGKALAAKTEFLATTSHEIRTPLNGILGMTEVMLADRSLPEPARERVRLVHGAGTTMRALVDDILDVAKIEKGRLSLETAAFDLRDLIRDAAKLWEDQVRAKGVTFDVALHLPPGRLLGDAARIRQVVFNLLSNAAKFTDAGSIRVRADRDADLVRIAVSDTGVGIAPDKHDEVFESFRQADTSTTRRFGGTGLGLSISRDLARAMGGDLTIASSPGQGSTFTFILPVVDHVEAMSTLDIGDHADALLVVDRNPIMRAMFRDLLLPYAGRITLAATLDEAIATIDAQAPRSVLIDDGAVGAQAERLARVAVARGAAIMLLRSPGKESVLPMSFTVIDKPITGPALIALMFPEVIQAGYPTRLESRAA